MTQPEVQLKECMKNPVITQAVPIITKRKRTAKGGPEKCRSGSSNPRCEKFTSGRSIKVVGQSHGRSR
jgi:hypothetical protein